MKFFLGFVSATLVAAIAGAHSTVCPYSRLPLPVSLHQDGVADCCDGSDEAGNSTNVCATLRDTMSLYSKQMYSIHLNGLNLSKEMRVSVQQTKRTMAGMLAWSSSAASAARKHYAFFRELADRGQMQSATRRLSTAFIQNVNDARFAAQQASLEAAMAQAAIDSMREGQAVFQATLLQGGCAESQWLSTKLTAGGSAEPLPSNFSYRICPFRNATQLSQEGEGSVLGVWLNHKSKLSIKPSAYPQNIVPFIRKHAALHPKQIVRDSS